MRVAAMMFITDRTMPPDEVAREAESRGFESLWVPEHTHMPVDHSPWPGGPDLPDEYRRLLDPFVALTAAASATRDLRVGTGIILAAQHDPIVLAKQVASLDHVSGGRFELGVGYGWNVPECEHHGVAFGDRRTFVDEAIEAMTALWTEEEASYDGTHVSFAPSWAWPKPAQSPRPPVLLGAGLGPRAQEALVRWADGWMPIRSRNLADDVAQLRRALESAGRDADAFEVFVTAARDDDDHLERYRRIGVDRLGFWLPPAGRDEVIPAMDRFARVVEA